MINKISKYIRSAKRIAAITLIIASTCQSINTYIHSWGSGIDDFLSMTLPLHKVYQTPLYGC